jgi:hypothetical protein
MLVEQREGSVDPDYFQFYLRTGPGEYAAGDVSSAGDALVDHLEKAIRPTSGFGTHVGALVLSTGRPTHFSV